MLNNLFGGLEHEFYFPIYLECHHPSWLIFFRGVVSTTNKIIYDWWAFRVTLWQWKSQCFSIAHMASKEIVSFPIKQMAISGDFAIGFLPTFTRGLLGLIRMVPADQLLDSPRFTVFENGDWSLAIAASPKMRLQRPWRRNNNNNKSWTSSNSD